MSTVRGAFRLTRSLRVVKKTSTGLVGIPVNPNARLDLIAEQKKLLEAAKVNAGHFRVDNVKMLFFHEYSQSSQVFPPDIYYRQWIEQDASYKIQLCTDITDVSSIHDNYV